MRHIVLAAAALVAAFAVSAQSPSAAAGGYMWCKAVADNGADQTTYYSSVFAADAGSAQENAAAFKSEAEQAEGSAASVQAACYAAPSQSAAEQARGAAMQRAPGSELSWPG